jgi:hypothetical protein
VYLTECDPETVVPGMFLDAEIVGSREYDLVVRPVNALDALSVNPVRVIRLKVVT